MSIEAQTSAATGVTPIAAYSVKSFSKAYSLSPATVNRLLKSGELRRTKVHGRTLILKRDAVEWERSLAPETAAA